MKKSIVLCCAILCALINGETPHDDYDRLPIQEHTFLVYRRYYFVARLDKTIKLLAKMYQEVSAMQGMLAGKQVFFDEIVPQETYRLFTHKQIRRSVKEILHTRSLKPLFMVWDSFKSYKSLHDDLLVEDFSKEIFIITRNTIDSLHKHDNLHRYKDRQLLTLEERLDALAEMTHVLEDLISGTPTEYVRSHDVGNIHLAVQTDEVAFRFYCIRRLRNALSYLLALPESDQSAHLVYASARHRFRFLQNKNYKHLPLRQSLQHSWDDVMQYKYIEDDHFMHDFAVYTLMLLYCQAPERIFKSLTHADLIAMQHRIEQLPLEDILKAIDLVVKQVHNVVNHYQKSGLTLSGWLKKYWWAPSMIITTVVIKCFLLYYKNFRTPTEAIPS